MPSNSIAPSESPFVDYFVVCGLPQDAHVEVQRSANTEDEQRAPLDRAYSNSILGCYPQHRHDAPFHEEVLALCMPRGLRFCTQRSVPSTPVFHTFALIREDGHRIDGAALTFYEKVQTGPITSKLHQLQLEHLSHEVQGDDEDVDMNPIHYPTSRSGSMRRDQGRQAMPFVHPPGQVTGGVHTLPRRRGQQRMTRAPRSTYYDAHKDTLYMAKCICILGRLPIIQAYETLLRAIHTMATSTLDTPALPLESYIFWMLHELPLPSIGSTLKVSIDEPRVSCTVDIVCQRPSADELPMFDHVIEHVLHFFPVDKLLKLYTCALLEHQILLCSKDMHRLMLVAESLCTLMYPFRWQYTYVPILPHCQSEFLEAPMPFIMGLCIEDDIPDEVYQSTVVVVDIDRGHVEIPEDLPQFPDRQELLAEICDVIKHFNQSTYDTSTAAAHGHPTEPAHPLDPHPSSTVNQPPPFGTDEFDRLYSEMTMSPSVPVRRAYQEPSDAAWKRNSRSFDHEAMLDRPPLLTASNTTESRRENLQPFDFASSDAVRRSMENARRVGVSIPSMDTLQSEVEARNKYTDSETAKRYFHNMRFNNAIRELFMYRFVRMFHSYEHFVVGQGKFTSKEDYYQSRDSSIHTFDKAGFLSDQPDSHLKFLAAFLETQMFATLIDAKIVSEWETSSMEDGFKLLDTRIAALREKYGEAMVRTPVDENAPLFHATETLIMGREQSFDYIVARAHVLEGVQPRAHHTMGVFPTLQHNVLSPADLPSPQRSPWHVASRSRTAASPASTPPSTTTIKHPPPVINSLSTSKTQNWRFVDQLLNETKSRTKRMLVDKMGRREAEALGHSDVSITGVEENTLVASFCDLLERVWAHGAVKKQGKSALWTHLVALEDVRKNSAQPPMIDNAQASSNPCPTEPSTSSEAGGLVNWMQGLQAQGGEGEAAPAWSSSLLKAASYFANKLQNTSTQNLASAPTSPYRQPMGAAQFSTRTNQQQASFNGKGRASSTQQLARHSSFSDLAPSGWSQPTSARSALTPQHRSGGTLPHRHSRSGLPSHMQAATNRGESVGRSDTRSYTSPRKQRSLSRPRSPPQPRLPPLPTNLLYDLKNVCRIADIKTDIGYARAFVRLSLERKLLHSHVQTLVENRHLLKRLYRRTAFLRTDDEIEQFLFHVLSLNAADFRCFTNSFPKIKMQYQVLLVVGGGRFSSAPSSVFIRLAGTFGETSAISLPKSTTQFTFDHRNLGVLSTLRVGHKYSAEGGWNDGAKWFLDEVFIRNELTGQTYRFACARWFGSNVDDGSLERLLVAEVIPLDDGAPTTQYETSTLGRATTPSHSRARSPSSNRRASSTVDRARDTNNPRAAMASIEHSLGNCVNAIVKHFHATTGDVHEKVEHRQQLTQLLCGDGALVQCLEEAFLYNFRSTRMFRNYYMWDYVERTCQWFYDTLRSADSAHFRHEQKVVMKRACKLCARVGTNSTLGKDGKFHTWLLLAIRDKLLPGVLTLMAWTPITGESYDEPSFVRSSNYRNFLIRLLESLNEFTFELEASLTRDVDGKTVTPW